MVDTEDLGFKYEMDKNKMLKMKAKVEAKNIKTQVVIKVPRQV